MKTASLFWLRDDGGTATELLAATFSPDERTGLAGLTSPSRQRSFVLSRRLLRRVLSPRLCVPEGEIHFRRTGSGRLLLAGDSSWQFSLSHTANGVAAVVAQLPCGVDIETVRDIPVTKIAQRYFADSEVRHLAALAPDIRQQEFLRLWTLKEAGVKALGQGLARNLARLAFDPGSEPPALLDAAIGLQFFQEVHDGFFLAGAVADAAAPEWQVREIAVTDLLAD